MNKRDKIIVAVDFSDCSINALEHAVSIAAKAKADLKMVWVNKATSEYVVALKESAAAASDAEKRFEELVSHYKPLMGAGSIDYCIRDGKVYREVVNQAKYDDAFLIVTGTHGSSGFEEFLIGSNANKIVSAAECPVITIRGGINIKRKLSRIVLPVDSSLETRQKVGFTSRLAHLFDAEIFVLSLYSSGYEGVQIRVDGYTKQVLGFLEDEGLKYSHHKRKADNITTASIEFAKEIDANLISIMTEQEKTTANLWLGPYAHQMVNHSPIPVLCIKPEGYMISLQR